MAKGFAFQDITISLFDVHTTVEPHAAPGTDDYQNELRFLGNEGQYNQRQQELAQKAQYTPSFEIRQLSKKEQDSYFWEAYRSSPAAPGANPWRLQIPFALRLRRPGLELNEVGAEGVAVHLRQAVYLSALGWSTIFDIRLKGDLLDEDFVIGLVGRLTEKYPEVPPFCIAGQPKTTTGTFQYFRERLESEVYTPRPDRRRISPRQHLVVSLNKFDGEPAYFFKDPQNPGWLYSGLPAMADADRALMLSFLLGRRVKLGEVGEIQRSLLHTRISGPNFALTNFNYGTLIFLQRDALIPKKEGGVHCFAKNVRNVVLMSYSLLQFDKYARRLAADTRAAELSAYARDILQGLPEVYDNQVCRTLFRKHAELAPLAGYPVPGEA